MKTKNIIPAMIFILAARICLTAQSPDLANLIEDAKKNAVTTAKSQYFEFGSDRKWSVIKPNGKSFTRIFELVCSNKHCELIQTEENGKRFSEKKINRNRENAAKKFINDKSDSKDEIGKSIKQYGYNFTIATASNPKINSVFSPYLYLKICKAELLEKQTVENRLTVKIRSYDCNLGSEPEKESFLFMPKTEAVIWIDEADKTVIKTEIYGEEHNETAINFNKPLVIMETAKIPQGGWFWSKISINADDNEYFFPPDYGNWQIDFFNYKKFNVDINKAEIDKKSN